MNIREARSIIGKTVSLTWLDRNGNSLQATTFIHKADFVPMYGPCLFTDEGEISLDRVVKFTAGAQEAA